LGISGLLVYVGLGSSVLLLHLKKKGAHTTAVKVKTVVVYHLQNGDIKVVAW